MFAKYAEKYPELASEIRSATEGKPLANLEELMPSFEAGKSLATRKASAAALNAFMPKLANVIGGSADLTPSNNTKFNGAEDFTPDNRVGRYIRYGVREHAMAAIMNGIAVSGIVVPYGGTFFVFSDYMRPAIRVAALSNYPTIFVCTHDSIGVGEDGPTHQPVEHLAAIRAIPNILMIRPADAYETAYAWKYVLENRDAPAVLALTRQGLPVLDQDKYASAENLYKGAYVVIKGDNPQLLLLATGSEVSVAIEAYERLAEMNISSQVVSMPSWELFDKQSRDYKDSVLPPSVKKRIGIEAGVRLGWDQWLGDEGEFIGMSSFGASAPGKTCFEKFGITVARVIETAKEMLS
jgi:transketolase